MKQDQSDPIRHIVLLGYGNIGQALSPLLRQRFASQRIDVFDERMTLAQQALAEQYGLRWTRQRITQDNHLTLLGAALGVGSLVINVATSISSLDVIRLAQQQGAFYLDTCIDPWEYLDGTLDSATNTNYCMREQVMALQAAQRAQKLPTAVVAHGANPGLVSLLVKEALLLMARAHLPQPVVPCGAAEWALLAETLGVRVIQISERDHQHTDRPRSAAEFVNTWSVDGFVAEALQPVELGWGSHEHAGPLAVEVRHHDSGCKAAVYLPRFGVQTRVRTWTPQAGEFTGYLISHNEAISLASFLTVGGGMQPRYRPTVYYAYHPCDQALESLALLVDGHRHAIASARVLKDELDGGIDELGVLLVSDRHPSLWLGSQLSIQQARRIAPHNNATSLQVVGSMMAAIAWIQAHPQAGIVESEAMDHEFLLARARPYWEPIVHATRAWHPSGQTDNPVWTLDQFLV
ncbi:saccharopine dehydrogenase NADP-binding domain-containing protein [Sphaerotilus sp.]|uniref:saccharopine dehydrogenase NADP-binding domain-containing protein n=1 Tax=Sphaerotilus sp. TaxID=2093942 RepID=UPI0034E1CFF2